MSTLPPSRAATSAGVVFPAASHPRELPAFVQAIETAGFDEVWLLEDCFLSGGPALAATVLALTQRVRVGIGLLPASVRNPAVAAMEIATLASIHPGRLSVAFGHGVEAWMQQIGARPSNRLTALREVVSSVRGLLAGETVTLSGGWGHLDAVALDQPPEILIGTTGAQGIRIAAEHADGVLLPEGSSESFIADTAHRLRGSGDTGDRTHILATYVWLAAAGTPRWHAALEAAFENWLDLDLYPAPIAALQAGAGTGRDRPTVKQVAITGGRGHAATAARSVVTAGSDRLILTAPIDAVAQYEWFAAEVLPLIKA